MRQPFLRRVSAALDPEIEAMLKMHAPDDHALILVRAPDPQSPAKAPSRQASQITPYVSHLDTELSHG